MPNDPSLGGNYALGLTNPPTYLESVGVQDPHPTELQPFVQAVPTGSGKNKHLGRPVCKWTFGMLDQRQYNYLIDFVKNGSADVFIRTRVSSGVTPTWTVFSATMHFPTKASSKPGGLWADVEIVFSNLTNA